MAKVKSERHHWWPECVSDFWGDVEGGVNWLLPDGSIRRSTPNNFGVIGNGHTIKLVQNPGETSPWDECFEGEFRNADDAFPRLIRWLRKLPREARSGVPLRARFLSHSVSDEQFGQLIEALVSLAVRSPMNREAAVSLAEQLRGPLPERERNVLIGSNMRHAHRRAVKAFGSRGKIAVIYSPDREFVFGDGFYHNLISPSMAPHAPEILAPLTPEISVLYSKPIGYMVEPRLSTIIIDAEEALVLNDTVQIYARQALFYRSEKPVITEAYRHGRHLRYSRPNHPLQTFLHSLPGVPDRDTSLDFLADLIERA